MLVTCVQCNPRFSRPNSDGLRSVAKGFLGHATSRRQATSGLALPSYKLSLKSMRSSETPANTPLSAFLSTGTQVFSLLFIDLEISSSTVFVWEFAQRILPIMEILDCAEAAFPVSLSYLLVCDSLLAEYQIWPAWDEGPRTTSTPRQSFLPGQVGEGDLYMNTSVAILHISE
jgi:hypothetical protein